MKLKGGYSEIYMRQELCLKRSQHRELKLIASVGLGHT